ncbi:MAG: DUF362 domain-containing protein [Angelakisella sp.]
MMKGLVSAKSIKSYDADLLRSVVAEQFETLELTELLTPGRRVVIKPNLLTGRDPSVAITTHPAVIQAVVDWLREHGITDITLADSPGGVYTPQRMKSVYHACGMDKLTGIVLHEGIGWQTRFRQENVTCKSFNLIDPIANADVIINMAKLKTHGMTTFTAGIKNLFGCIPGLQKPEMHYRYPQTPDFSGMLVDLSRVVAPVLTVIDAIDAMEGEGPSGGTVRHMGYLFASRDLYAQDWFACSVIGIDPQTVDMLRIAREQGLVDPEKIEVVGDIPKSIAPFELPKAHKSLLFVDYIPAFLRKPARALVARVLRSVPQIIKPKCIGCGRCAESCPAHTIAIKDKKAVINLDNCISCFCCQEMCPVKAIDVKRNLKF